MIVTAAVSNRLNPSIGRIRCLIRRWSCSTTLFRYLLDRIRTRRGTVPIDFSSAIALCDAAYASSVTTRDVPLFFIALRKKRFAAATSRRSLNRKSMCDPAYQLLYTNTSTDPSPLYRSRHNARNHRLVGRTRASAFQNQARSVALSAGSSYLPTQSRAHSSSGLDHASSI
jgi:hypothetical protein